MRIVDGSKVSRNIESLKTEIAGLSDFAEDCPLTHLDNLCQTLDMLKLAIQAIKTNIIDKEEFMTSRIEQINEGLDYKPE